MPRVKNRNYSLYTREACRLLGLLVRNSRKERRMSVEELAERAGTSPAFVRRLEQGGLKGEIGVSFEVAHIAGVNLFVPEEISGKRAEITFQQVMRQAEHIATLLPKRVHKPAGKIEDDF